MRRNDSGGAVIRLALGAIIAIISLVSYFMSGEVNPVTGEKSIYQHDDGSRNCPRLTSCSVDDS